MILSRNYKILNIFREFLQSIYLPIALFCCGFIFWLTSLSFCSVAIFSVFAIAVLLFCKNINNFYACLIYIPFFIKDIAVGEPNWIGYIICISCALLCLFSLLIKILVFEKKSIKKGNMYYAFAVMTIACLFSGFFARYNLLNTIMVLGGCIAVIMLYFLAKNRTENLGEYLSKVFLLASIFIFLEIIVGRIILTGSIVIGTPEGELFFFSSQSINGGSLYMVLGMVGALGIGIKRKHDFLFFILSTLIFVGIILTSVRLSILLGAITLIVQFILFIIYSPKKLNFVYILFVFTLVLGAFIVIKFDFFMSIVNMIINKIKLGLNGRDKLWPWCWEKFLQYPILGYGFYADEAIPGIRDYAFIILAHNTVIQILTSCGILGAILLGFNYFTKYKIVFFNPKNNIFEVVSVLVIAFSGMLDQTATMDLFMVVATTLLIVSCEEKNEKTFLKNRLCSKLSNTVDFC